MLDPRTRKLMEKSVGRTALVGQGLIFACGAGMLLLAGFKVVLASRWGSLDGLRLPYLMQQWFSGPDVHERYSGTFVRAMADLDGAFLYLAFAAVLTTTALNLRAQSKQNQKVIAELQSHAAW